MAMVTATLPRKRDSHIWAREVDEHYVEPRWCSERLFAEELFTDAIWDPACGFGHITGSALLAGLKVRESDIADRGCGYRQDFLKSNQDFPNIVTNPPFNIAADFSRHAIKLAHRKVAIVFPTARLNAAHWLQGLPLRRVWLLTPRPSMPPGHVIASGQKPGGGKMDFCWLVFERGYCGLVQMDWLRRDV